MTTPLRLLLMVLFATAPMGCILGPGLEPLPSPVFPEQWEASKVGNAALSQAWLDDLSSPRLKDLVREALAQNHTLQQAAYRRAAAREKQRIAGSSLWPTLQGELDGSRARVTSSGKATTNTNYAWEGSLRWETDLWGRIAASEKATEFQAVAAEEDFRAAQLSLAADVARNWFGLIEAGQQVRLADQAVASYQRSIAVVEEQYRAGLVDALDLRLARTDLADADTILAQNRRAQETLVRSLEILLGRYPKGELVADQTLPLVIKPVPAGLPSELLARRPDLLAAERRLTAAGEHVDAARKNRLPSLRLTARSGYASPAFRELLDWDTLVWNLVGGVIQPLFQGGKLQAEEALARLERKQLWAAYAQAVLVAFREVETALAVDLHDQTQAEALAVAVEEATLAADLALSRYRSGLVDSITLLEAQRRAYRAKNSHLRAVRERLNNRIALYLALGGDFQTQDDPS